VVQGSCECQGGEKLAPALAGPRRQTQGRSKGPLPNQQRQEHGRWTRLAIDRVITTEVVRTARQEPRAAED
jgi:hypothetical protein